MRTTFTISGQTFNSLATAEEATRWAVLDRPFPASTDADEIPAALAKASLWLEGVVTISEPEPAEYVVRCVVRLATYFAIGDLVPVAPSPASVSNASITVDMRYAGRQDQDEAHRLGFPDIETYRLVLPLLRQGGSLTSFTSASSYDPPEPL